MRAFDWKKYIRLVENSKDKNLLAFMRAEKEMIWQVKDANTKTFVDLGAGYGRILPDVAKIARNVILIECNPNMLVELERRSKTYKNTCVIIGDIQKLSTLLQDTDCKNPVLLLMQNTIGTIEGDYRKVLFEMKKVAQKNHGEIIISFFRQEALEKWGIGFFATVSEMIGEPDLEKTDCKNGLFVSRTGYTSKWHTSTEIEEIKSFFGGKVINEIWKPWFAIIHFSFN